MKGKPINLIGKRFTRLVVIAKVKSTPSGSIWKVKCDCGNIRFLRTSRLTGKEQKSCGCLIKEIFKKQSKDCEVTIINGKRKCAKCKKFKSIKNFAKSNKTKSGLQCHCKNCSLAYEWAKSHNITFEVALKLVSMKKKAQCGNEKCKTTKDLHLDHDHKGGVIRGFLCGPCNRALGLLKDNHKVIIGLHNYLIRENRFGADNMLSRNWNAEEE